MQFVNFDEYEAWQQRWMKRPKARINEGKVQRRGRLEMMPAQAMAPGFRSESVMVIHEVSEEV